MQLVVNSVYRMEVSQEELNLIGLALCGRLKPEQQAAAHDLNRRLLEQRRMAHAQHVELSERAMDDLGYPKSPNPLHKTVVKKEG